MELFSSLSTEGKTVMLVTHERDLTRYVSRKITLVDGAIVAGINFPGGSKSNLVEEVAHA